MGRPFWMNQAPFIPPPSYFFQDEFETPGTPDPLKWPITQTGICGPPIVSGGELSLPPGNPTRAYVRTDTIFQQGDIFTLESDFRLDTPYQQNFFNVYSDDNNWFSLSNYGLGNLWFKTRAGGVRLDAPIIAATPGYHRFRMEWNPGDLKLFVDDALKAYIPHSWALPAWILSTGLVCPICSYIVKHKYIRVWRP